MPTTTFHCPDGGTIEAAIGPRYAALHLPPDRVVRLYREPAASGARYSDGRYALHTRGNEALLERGGNIVHRDCRVAGAAAAVDSVLTPIRARSMADSIDALTSGSSPVVRALEPQSKGAERRVLSLWADSAGPVKLTVTEPDAAGKMSGLTSYYFPGGRLEFARGPVSQYLFRDTTLILWTTDSIHHVSELPLRDMTARQNFVLGEVRQYLAMFGIGQ